MQSLILVPNKYWYEVKWSCLSITCRRPSCFVSWALRASKVIPPPEPLSSLVVVASWNRALKIVFSKNSQVTTKNYFLKWFFENKAKAEKHSKSSIQKLSKQTNLKIEKQIFMNVFLFYFLKVGSTPLGCILSLFVVLYIHFQ